MSAADLHDLSDALGIEPGKLEAVLAIVREAVGGSAALAEREWLTVDDVARLTKQTSETVQDKARRGRIPMFKDGRDWKMTPAAFEKWERRVSTENMAMAARHPLKRRR